jgi:ABC-type nitrate/sulfonate/bicarbonate transport system substrate-binding protein
MRRAVLAALAALVAGACGGSSSHPAVPSATLVLDFTPNAVHAGIYSALARGYDRDQGVRLRVVAPSATTDSIKLLETGRAKFAILDIHDLAIARERGADIVGIMAIVERPLAAVVAGPEVHTPSDLVGHTVGITGVPSDTAVLRSIVAGAGGDPAKLHTITIGFNAVADLLAGRVAAATAFWNDEGVTLARRRPGFHSFRVDDYGAPAYPELVLCASGATVHGNLKLAEKVVRTLANGYTYALHHPAQSASDLEHRVGGLDPRLVSAQLSVLLPAFHVSSGRVGVLDPDTLRAWAAWELRFGIVKRPVDLGRTFDVSLVSDALHQRL